MSDNSSIEWTDSTWTPIRARVKEKIGPKAKNAIGWYCEHVSDGCTHCYAERMNQRLGTGLPFKPGHRKDVELFLDENMLTLPLRWKKPRMIFVCSMTDLFADFVPDEWIDKVFAVMALSPQHTFQVLTKRAGRMQKYMTEEIKGPWAGRAFRIDDNGTTHAEWDVAWRMRSLISDMLPTMTADSLNRACKFMDDRDGGEGDGFFRSWPLPNVWLGVSTERQQEADERIPLLLQTPAAVRFISAEPLLGPIDLTRLCILPQKPGSVRAGIHINAVKGNYCESGLAYTGDWDITKRPPPDSERRKLDWVIAGGESGPNARPMHPDWARSLRDQCQAAGVAFFFKQWGEWAPSTAEQAAGNPRSGWQTIRSHPCVAKAHELYPESGAAFIARVGKKAAGRLLDGVEHNAMPERRA